MKNKNTTDTDETAELNANLQHWKKLIEGLPEVRVDKIERARQAINEHHYDDDGVVEVTLDRICSEKFSLDNSFFKSTSILNTKSWYCFYYNLSGL